MVEMNTLEVLRKAKGHIAQGWTQKFYAKKTGGGYTWPNDPMAVCYCPIGAMMKAIDVGMQLPFEQDEQSKLNQFHTTYHILMRYLDTGFDSIVRWNDSEGRTQDEVLFLFDKAIVGEQDIQDEPDPQSPQVPEDPEGPIVVAV